MTRTDIINSLIQKFGYIIYLEIGTQNSVNYKAVNCKYKRGIDPEPLRMFPGIMKMTSDEYFCSMLCDYMDICFIDGLHHAEQVYKDIIYSLHFLMYNGTIVCHDINPINEEAQRVPRETKIWNGDSWKAWMNIKKRYSEYLEMFVVDTDYGCGIIRVKEGKKLGKVLEKSFKNLKLEDYKYEDLEKNREKMLSLITVKQFQRWLVKTM